MNMLYMVCGLLVALGVLVTFHEFGHFWVARRCGVKVLRFSVGFGTPLVRWHDRHGTEFVVAAIPLGGYVKMLDERETDAHIATEDLPFAFNRKPVLQRIAIVSAGPIANFLLAIFFFWVLAMMGSQQVRPVIGAVEPQSLAAQAGLAAGQEIVAVDGERTTGWSNIGLQLVRRLGESGQIAVQVIEPGSTSETTHTVQLQDWLKGADEPDPISSLGIRPWRPAIEPIIATLDPDGPGQAAGLKVGDRLLTLDGVALDEWQQLIDGVRPRAGQRVMLVVQRDGHPVELPITLAAKGNDKAQAGYLGAGPQVGEWPADMLREVSFGPLESVSEALKRTWTMSLLTLDSLKKMLFGELSVKNLSGPITIAKVAGASAQSGVGDFLNFLAYLSISLGVLNLLPIPVLDGGHLLFYLIEWVRGRPVSERVQGWGMQIGISLVVGVMLLALVNDLSRF
ncbi:sigma E protease regulator RseP [Pseudomonas turukhanskensis]|uniref:Zinc metalloprotease n=1 Tax=Pseudomonas turukhanskensis TaxID=1806536 RepID=A0A9W6NEF8_9PSED|nr:sigma E protease regulator RseP [Pseudomonas turukhanskensis]GLK87943.1 putative zinc metalloprotease [Pseudomonas turukhanskensis]